MLKIIYRNYYNGKPSIGYASGYDDLSHLIKNCFFNGEFVILDSEVAIKFSDVHMIEKVDKKG